MFQRSNSETTCTACTDVLACRTTTLYKACRNTYKNIEITEEPELFKLFYSYTPIQDVTIQKPWTSMITRLTSSIFLLHTKKCKRKENKGVECHVVAMFDSASITSCQNSQPKSTQYFSAFLEIDSSKSKSICLGNVFE